MDPIDREHTPITLKVPAIMRTLWLFVAGLGLAHAAVHGLSARYGWTPEQMLGLKRFFDLGTEANLPSYFSALLLLFTALLMALVTIGQTRRRGKVDWHWTVLAALVAFLSVDEAAMIHDGMVGPAITHWFGRGTGIAHYNWYKVYVPAALLVLLLYLPFLRRLSRPLMLRLAAAGAVFVGGAVGFEMIESYLMHFGLKGINLVRLFEETAEMAGVVLAIRALLLELRDGGYAFVLSIGPARHGPA